MKNKNSGEFMIAIFVIIIVVLFNLFIIHRDSKRCEKNGGIYIWEYNEGTKCHIKGEQKWI